MEDFVPPRTPVGTVRPRVKVSRPAAGGGKEDGSGGSASMAMSAFSAAPIAPAAKGQLKGSTALASPNELADYTKRKVAEIMMRERQTLSRDVAGGGRTSRMSDMSGESMDVDDDRPQKKGGRGGGGGGGGGRGGNRGEDESESESEESDQEEDADQLFMMELKKERLSKQTKMILCLGFSGLIAGFLALFFVLMYVTIQKECSDPWFHQTEHFSNSEAPRCGMLKRCARPTHRPPMNICKPRSGLSLTEWPAGAGISASRCAGRTRSSAGWRT